MAKKRYCGMCDVWWPVKHRECPKCGADTEKPMDAPDEVAK